MNRILITGGEGMLGSYFTEGRKPGSNDLDVTDAKAVQIEVEQSKPEIIIHVAALTDLAVCENNPEHAFFVNAVGTYNVARAAQSIGAKMVYVSTSGVFDGVKEESYEATDAPNPVTVYGHSKYLGELAVQALVKNHLIVRASWLFGGGPGRDHKFIGKIMSQTAEEIRAVDDKIGSPTYAMDLALHIEQLLRNDEQGIQHFSSGSATRFDIARELCAITGSKTTVVPVPSSEFPLVYSSGKNEAMERTAGVRSWQEALAEYVGSEWNNH